MCNQLLNRSCIASSFWIQKHRPDRRALDRFFCWSLLQLCTCPPNTPCCHQISVSQYLAMRSWCAPQSWLRMSWTWCCWVSVWHTQIAVNLPHRLVYIDALPTLVSDQGVSITIRDSESVVLPSSLFTESSYSVSKCSGTTWIRMDWLPVYMVTRHVSHNMLLPCKMCNKSLDSSQTSQRITPSCCQEEYLDISDTTSSYCFVQQPVLCLEGLYHCHCQLPHCLLHFLLSVETTFATDSSSQARNRPLWSLPQECYSVVLSWSPEAVTFQKLTKHRYSR